MNEATLAQLELRRSLPLGENIVRLPESHRAFILWDSELDDLCASLRECRELLAIERAKSKRVKREGQSFMDWLHEQVEASPEAKAAYQDELRTLLATVPHDDPQQTERES